MRQAVSSRLLASKRRACPWLGRGKRGQSLVEFSLAIPVFLFLLIGSLDMGMLFKTHIAYQEAVQEAVRIDASTGGSDQLALNQLQAMLPVENLNNIVSVTVYDATISGAQVTASTTPSSTTPDATTYTYSSATNGFVCAGTSSPPPCDPTTTWDPSKRNSTFVQSATQSLDRLAIKVVYKYRSLLGEFAPLQLTEVDSAQLEPTTYPTSSSG